MLWPLPAGFCCVVLVPLEFHCAAKLSLGHQFCSKSPQAALGGQDGRVKVSAVLLYVLPCLSTSPMQGTLIGGLLEGTHVSMTL